MIELHENGTEHAEDDNIQVCQGLTDDQRREIRKSQRLLRKEIDSIDVDEARDRNNEIFKSVRYVRESVLDAENVDEIAKKAANKVDQLIQVPRYDADRVVRNLVEKCRVTKGGTSYFDWRKLGVQAGICFNAIPSQVSFLNGPLVDGNEEVQVKQRAKRMRDTQPESDNEEERPEDIKGHTARGANQLSAVQKNIDDVKKALRKKVDREYLLRKKKIIDMYGGEEKIPERIKKRVKKNPDTCAIELLFNPESFTQTVENVYHYSFLVREGEASLSVRETKVLDKETGLQLNGGPVVKHVNYREENPQPRQAIVSLTMDNWRKLCKEYDVKSSGVPNRATSKGNKK